MSRFDEKTIKLKEYEVLGKLPDPFLRADGTRVSTVEEFEEHRAELYRNGVEFQYGKQPPAPEFLEIEPLYIANDGASSYRITSGRREHPVSFIMRTYLPHGKKGCPVIVDGDLCFNYAFDKEWLNVALDNGIGIVLFNRCELAPDVKASGRRGQMYECYPEYDFGALGAWAWGYSRCVDALERLDLFDMDWVVFTGHSRGAKTAMLAGILDKRARIVNPNETCQGSCSCYRIHMNGITEDGGERKSETLADLWQHFSFWVGQEMGNYTDREEELPFDAHYLKALVAPRALLVGEAASDMWANPVGSWMTTQAAKEVFKLYGKEDSLYWYFRPGYHYHKPYDLSMLVSVIKHEKDGEPLPDEFYYTPFDEPELIYDWRCPEKK
jgi:hypothetical protein